MTTTETSEPTTSAAERIADLQWYVMLLGVAISQSEDLGEDNKRALQAAMSSIHGRIDDIRAAACGMR